MAKRKSPNVSKRVRSSSRRSNAYQRGLGMNAFHGVRIQRGSGLGNILGGLFRRAMPFLWKGAKFAGKTALNTGIDVAKDVIDGRDIKSAVKTRTRQAGNRLANQLVERVTSAVKSQTGRGRKKTYKRGARIRRATSGTTPKSTRARPKAAKTTHNKKRNRQKPIRNQDIFGFY